MSESISTWDKMVHASFRKVVAFDLLFLGLGIPIGAAIATAILTKPNDWSKVELFELVVIGFVTVISPALSLKIVGDVEAPAPKTVIEVMLVTDSPNSLTILT